MQEGEGALDTEGREDQPAGQAVESDVGEGERAALLQVQQGPGQQQHAGQDLDHQVAQAGGQGAFTAPGPHQEHRGNREQFPEHEQCQEIAGEHGTQCAAGVHHGGDMLQRVLHVQGEDDRDECRDQEQVAEHPAEAVDAQRHQGVAEELELQQFSAAQAKQAQAAQQRCGEQDQAARGASRERGQQCCCVEHQEGRELRQCAHGCSPLS